MLALPWRVLAPRPADATMQRSPPSALAETRAAVLVALLALLAATLPFEPIRPLASLAGFDLNHLKLGVLALAAVWLVGLFARGGLLFGAAGGRTTTAAAAGFLLLAALSAALAPSDRAEALKFVGRLAFGLVVLVASTEVLNSQQRLRVVLWATCGGAALSALLGLGEASGWPALEPLLALFKVAPTRVGAEVRVSASFQYATIAAMYFELVAPLALALAASAATRRAWLAATCVGVLSSVVLVLTLTRAALLGLGVAFALLLLYGLRYHRALLPPTVIATAAATVTLVVVALSSSTPFATRLATENDWGWYAASYRVPATLELNDGQSTQATVEAHNDGQAVWTSGGPHPFALAYRWLSGDDTEQLQLPPQLVPLPHDVAPGESIALEVPLRPPPALAAGDYRLAWGMLQQDVLWFHDRGHPDAESVVTFARNGASGSEAGVIAQAPRTDIEQGLPPVPRLELWRAAWRMFTAHPLLGIGPDNFRHTYGNSLGLEQWDQRIHANSLYLELLADFGLLGSIAFGAIVALASVCLARTIRGGGVLLAGLAASLLSFFVHGTLDYFLDFLPTALLFWLILGASSAAPAREPC